MVLEKTLPIIIVFILGYFLKKLRVLEKKDAKVLGKLLINFVIPAVIINTFSKISIERGLVYLPVSALIVVSSFTLAGYLLARLLNLSGKTKGAFITVMPTLEGGSIGYAFMLSAFGELGLSRIILFDFANAIYLFTVVYFISCSFGNEKANIWDSLAKLLKTPLIWAIAIGFFLNFTGIKSSLLSGTLDIISSSTLLLVMLMLGLEFEPEVASFKLPVLTILLKTSIGFALGWLISSFFGFTGIERIAVIVGASLPPSILTLIFSEENNLDTKYVASLLSIAVPFALIYLTILLNFI